MFLSSHTNIYAGHPFRGAVKNEENGDVRVLQGKDINTDHFINWDTLACTHLSTKKDPIWLEEGDIIFAARGARNYSVLLENVPKNSLCSPQFFIIRPIDKNKTDPEFLCWQLNQDHCQQHFELNRTGTTVGNIKRQALEAAPIAIPSLQKQRQILKLTRTIHKEKAILIKLIENLHQQERALANQVVHEMQAEE